MLPARYLLPPLDNKIVDITKIGSEMSSLRVMLFRQKNMPMYILKLHQNTRAGYTVCTRSKQNYRIGSCGVGGATNSKRIDEDHPKNDCLCWYRKTNT